jgi:hypothetical protein
MKAESVKPGKSEAASPLTGRPGLVTECAETNPLARELGQLAKRHGLRGAVLISFTEDRVGVNSSGDPAAFAIHMERLGERLLAAIDDGAFDPLADAHERAAGQRHNQALRPSTDQRTKTGAAQAGESPARSAPIRIFAMNDCDWMAAKDLESAVAAYLKDFAGGLVKDEALDNPHELSEDDMDRMAFSDLECNPVERRSFRGQLNRMIAEGVEFPTLFASTEY